jgi:small subunit ribosomal protein S17
MSEDMQNTDAPEATRRRRTLQGVVVSDKMDKTVVVKVTRQVLHARYKKIVRQSKRYKAHDEVESCGMGDLVTIVESRPLSKSKRWRVQSIDRKAVG